MKQHLQNWGALYILVGLFLVSLGAQYWFQVVLEQETASQFGAAIFENWQSEWIQLFVQALLLQGLGHLIYRKETEDQERMEAKLDTILRALEQSAASRPA